jgi:hypothetical protein
MYLTEMNNNGRKTPGTELLNLQSFIELHAPTFGLTVYQSNPPSGLNPLNVDKMMIQVKNIVETAHKNHLPGLAAQFINIATQAGVVMDPLILLGKVVTNIAAASIGQHGAVISWDQFINNILPVTYNIQILVVGQPPVINIQGLTAHTYTATGLVHATTYQVRVQASWNSGIDFTNWSFINFTTLT